MQPGDTIETAIWLDGRETKEQRQAFEKAVIETITEDCAACGVIHGKVLFHVKHPYDERVPPVPEHVKGDQPRLLVAEADIIGTQRDAGSFIANLDEQDIHKLRQLTRQICAKNGMVISDMQADDIIEDLGPDVIYDMVLH